jgi:hypothetical protein
MDMLRIDTGGGELFAKDWESAASLFAKIAKVTGSVGGLRETGKNKDQGYSYTSYDDVVAPLKAALKDANLGQSMQIQEVSQVPDGKGVRTHLRVSLILGDGDTGAMMVNTLHGEAMDYGTADKGINKAYTAAQKHGLKRLFLLATYDDAEDDADAKSKAEDDGQRMVRFPSGPSMLKDKIAGGETESESNTEAEIKPWDWAYLFGDLSRLGLGQKQLLAEFGEDSNALLQRDFKWEQVLQVRAAMIAVLSTGQDLASWKREKGYKIAADLLSVLKETEA